MPAVWFKNHFW